MELFTVDLMKFYCCSEKTAISRKKEIKEALGLPRKHRIHILHLCMYERLSVSDVRSILFE